MNVECGAINRMSIVIIYQILESHTFTYLPKCKVRISNHQILHEGVAPHSTIFHQQSYIPSSNVMKAKHSKHFKHLKHPKHQEIPDVHNIHSTLDSYYACLLSGSCQG